MPSVFAAGITVKMLAMTANIRNFADAVSRTLPVTAKQDAMPDIKSNMYLLWFSGLVIVLDQLTKTIAEASLDYRVPVNIFTGLNMTLVYNKGAAFSFLSDAGGWQRWFFMALSTIISIALVFWLRTVDKNRKYLAWGLALILGGAIGNLIDRSLYGYVIDFIDVYYSSWHWPAFNIADSAISLGAGLLILDMFLHRETG
jgi:signal peptidase II